MKIKGIIGDCGIERGFDLWGIGGTDFSYQPISKLLHKREINFYELKPMLFSFPLLISKSNHN